MSESQREAIIEAFSQKIEAWGLQAPAILFLEINKPFSFLGSQLLLLSRPVFRAFGKGQLISAWAEALEDRETLEQVIDRLEAGPLR